MDSVHILMVEISGIHVHDPAVREVAFECLLTLGGHRFHTRVPDKHELIYYCCKVRKSNRFNLVIGEGHTVHFQLEISCKRKINLADLIIRKRLRLKPPDSSRQSNCLDLVIHECIWKNCQNAVRKRNVRQLIPFKCSLCDYKVSSARNLVGNSVVI